MKFTKHNAMAVAIEATKLVSMAEVEGWLSAKELECKRDGDWSFYRCIMRLHNALSHLCGDPESYVRFRSAIYDIEPEPEHEYTDVECESFAKMRNAEITAKLTELR